MSSAPAIYVRLERHPTLNWTGRLLAFAISMASISILLAAAWITPDPSGHSTHVQLGLAPCSFLQRTGIPCAGCGMTTSFAWFVRGQLLTSFITQPFGMILAICTAACFWGGLYIALTGKASHKLLKMIPMKAHLVFWLGLALFGWVWKIIAVVSQHH